MFSDFVGSTALSARMDPAAIAIAISIISLFLKSHLGVGLDQL
jgi:hypothetical protein